MHPPFRHAPTPSDRLPTQVDVAIVGGGLSGLSAAIRLATEGVRVAVVESRIACGRGSGGRDPGVLTGGLPEHPWRLIHSIGAERTAEIYAISQRNREIIARFVELGPPPLHLAIDAREVDEIAKSAVALQGIGLKVTELDAPTATDRSAGRAFTAGMHVQGESSVDVEALCVAMVARLRQLGGHVCTDQRVTSLDRPGDTHRVHTAEGAIVADAVVLCAGWALKALDPWFSDKLLPVREHSLRYDHAPDNLTCGRAQYGYITWRRDELGGLVISGCRWATQHLEMGETEEVPLDSVLEKIRSFVASHLPVEDSNISHSWARILTATCDGLPILGPMPGDPTLLSCTGFQGFAPALALAAGEGVAQGLLTGEHGLPEWMSPRRFL
ncbi:MAG: NAD(P)/FAD-dependent oxidoreductase [Myxococcota bacterium]